MFQKSSALIISTAILLVAILGIVTAYPEVLYFANTEPVDANPEIFGHALEEIALPECTAGNVLGIIEGGKWGCVPVGGVSEIPSCAQGQFLVEGASGLECQPNPVCAQGQVLKSQGSTGVWECADDFFGDPIILNAWASTTTSITLNWTIRGIALDPSEVSLLRIWRFDGPSCIGQVTSAYLGLPPSVPLMGSVTDTGLAQNTDYSYKAYVQAVGGSQTYESACVAVSTNDVPRCSASASPSTVVSGSSTTVTVTNAGFSSTPTVSVDCGNGTTDSTSPFTCSYISAQAGAKTITATATAGSQTATCTASVTVTNCGNGVVDAGEQCDGSNLNGKTCVDFATEGGTLTCRPTCTFNTTQCITCPDVSGYFLRAGDFQVSCSDAARCKISKVEARGGEYEFSNDPSCGTRTCSSTSNPNIGIDITTSGFTVTRGTTASAAGVVELAYGNGNCGTTDYSVGPCARFNCYASAIPQSGGIYSTVTIRAGKPAGSNDNCFGHNYKVWCVPK